MCENSKLQVSVLQKIINKLQIQMQQSDNPTRQPPPPRQKQKNNVEEFAVLKHSKISHYPYYPISDTLSQNGFGYLFNIELTIDDYRIVVHPFKIMKHTDRYQYLSLNVAYVELESVPRKNINWLYILQYEDFVNGNGKGVTVKLIDFVVGFNLGYLIRCRYTNSARPEGYAGKKQFNIIGKFNKRPDYKEGLMMRMTSSFFGSDQFYKVCVEKPVRSFLSHANKQAKNLMQKYNYSYLIGNRLYLCKQFSEDIETEALKTFQEIQWNQMPDDSLAKLNKMNSVVIKAKRHKTLISSTYMLIEWENQISTYVYTSQNQLIVADNQENKIIIFDVLDSLKIKSVYNFDLDVKKLNYFKTYLEGRQQIILLVMPYGNALFVVNLTRCEAVSLSGHRSYVTQATLNESGYIITGGCDHRIGLKNLLNIKQWSNVNIVKGGGSGAKYYEINSSEVRNLKMDETYFLGEFNNVNSERNNNNGFGFGNFLRINGSQLYAFITYDFTVKIYKISV